MNSTLTLRLVFEDRHGNRFTVSYPDADGDASAIQVRSYMQLMIANREIFAQDPSVIVGAEFVQRAVTPINVAS